MLPVYQKKCLMYDRFVPFLGELADAKAASMSGNGWIVDIGANVGDTVAGLIRHTLAEVICVEPTTKYSVLLHKNVTAMGVPYIDRIHCVQAYIAENDEDAYVSQVVHGTAVKEKIAAKATAEAPTMTIPELLQLQNVASKALALVKVDTDGYDSECILSLGNLLSDISPILYWENAIEQTSQMKKYIQMTHYLAGHNYTHFFVFDNFGNFLAEMDAAGMEDVDYYLERILRQRSPRSFYYVDVLASKDEDMTICRTTISRYLRVYAQHGDA